MLKQAKAKNEINVFGFLKHIRTQRNFLVQTEEQYIFIHDALQEAIESGETNIETNNLIQHVQGMLCPSNNKTDAWNNIEAQYKVTDLEAGLYYQRARVLKSPCFCSLVGNVVETEGFQPRVRQQGLQCPQES